MCKTLDYVPPSNVCRLQQQQPVAVWLRGAVGRVELSERPRFGWRLAYRRLMVATPEHALCVLRVLFCSIGRKQAAAHPAVLAGAASLRLGNRRRCRVRCSHPGEPMAVAVAANQWLLCPMWRAPGTSVHMSFHTKKSGTVVHIVHSHFI